MTERIARFNELTPSTLPFVEGRIQGHKERKNYSIVGPGVAEDSQQSVKISKPHGYNLGAVSANPKNGSGLHSHTTAEVFLKIPERVDIEATCILSLKVPPIISCDLLSRSGKDSNNGNQ